MNDHTVEVIQRVCISLDTPRSLSIYIMLKERLHADLIRLKVDASWYNDPHAFAKDYFITNLLLKWKGFKIKDVDPEEVARQSFINAEAKCVSTNCRFRASPLVGSVSSVLHVAQRKIAEILGPRPTLDRIFSLCEWSGGATFSLRRGSDASQKMSECITVTEGLFVIASHLIGSDPAWCRSLGIELDGPICLTREQFVVVRGNKFVTVPKNAKTHRGISIEPSMNIFFQKGIGTYMRRRLKSFGVDLNDQSINRRLASQAHKLGLATVDLSSASDTVSFGLVCSLLPIDWLNLLNAARSPATLFQGSWHYNAKFSSMGNGYTFELESLIFYAVLFGVYETMDLDKSSLSVYGDDLIVDARVESLLKEVFDYCGFEINTEKSFFSGRFYESCGGHYFDGIDVTPVYQKEVTTTASELIRFHNRIYRWSHRNDVDLARPLQRIREVFRPYRYKGKFEPRIFHDYASDDGFIVDVSKLRRFCPNHGYYSLRLVARTAKTKNGYDAAQYAYKLRRFGIMNPDDSGRLILPVTLAYRYTHGYIGFPHGK